MRKLIEDPNRKFVRVEDAQGVELLENEYGHIYYKKGHWFASPDLCRIIAQTKFQKYDEEVHRYVAQTPEALITALQNELNPVTT